MRSLSQGGERWEVTRKPNERNSTRSWKHHTARAAKAQKSLSNHGEADDDADGDEEEEEEEDEDEDDNDEDWR